MEYLILLLISLLLRSSESFSTERYYEYYKSSNSGDNQADSGKSFKANTLAAYQVTEKVDDITDTRPRPGPVIPNYTVEKPLNWAQSNANKKYDNEKEDNFKRKNNPESNDLGGKGKHSHKYGYKENWSVTKGNWKSVNGDDGNDLLQYPIDKDFDDSEKKIRVGFYDSVKEVFSDFKNGVWKSFSNFFGKEDPSV